MSGGVVIVGTGVAGATAARSLRTGGYHGQITLIGREPHLPYRRPALSKDVLLAGFEVDDVLVEPPSRWADLDIQLRLGVDVEGGDTQGHSLSLADGGTLTYDTLVLATGSAARVLPNVQPGPRVHYLRSFADAANLRAALGTARSVVILGGGLIGSEVASAATQQGLQVTVIEPAPLPLARVVPPVVGARLASMHRNAGVDLRLGVTPTEFVVNDNGVAVTVGTGSPITADVMVVAVGSTPDTGLAQRLAVAVDDGIVVDEHYRTNVVDVFAVGDCARVPHPWGGTYRAENWSAAQDQGSAVARVLLGEVPAPTVPWGWSNQYGVVVQFAGWPAPEDTLEVDGAVNEVDGAFVARCRRDAALVGGVAINRPKDLRAVRKELADRLGIPA